MFENDEERQKAIKDIAAAIEGEEPEAPDSGEAEPQVSEAEASDLQAQADLEGAFVEPQEEPEAPKPEEPAEEPTPPAEAEQEASQEEGEPQPEGEGEPIPYDIPDDGMFVLTVDGEEKEYTGEAIKKMAMQGRLSGQKNVELKTAREQFDRERAEWEATKEAEKKTAVVGELLKLGVMRETAPGDVEWHPDFDPRRRREAVETAERTVDAREEGEEFKLPRITREDLGEDADLVPEPLLEKFNAAMEKAEQTISAERQRGDKLESGFQRKEQESFEQERNRIFQELDTEIEQQIGVKQGDPRYRMALNEALTRLEGGYEGEYGPMIGEIAGLLGAEPKPAPADPKPKPKDPPTGERKRVLQPPPRRSSAPPAVGSSGRRPPPADDGTPSEEDFDEHGFGNFESKQKLNDLIRKELGV